MQNGGAVYNRSPIFILLIQRTRSLLALDNMRSDCVAERHDVRNGVAAQTVGSVNAARHFADSIEYSGLADIIREHRPQQMAVEELFWNTNQTTGIRVAEARGVILLCGHKNGLEIAEYTPLHYSCEL